jgi:cyclopropane fatty-acyl-phospholipid synthase-like methyltransferase
MQRPYSESCDQNKLPILSVIEPIFIGCSVVLEIGSGTGQHAVYFAEKMPHLQWRCSDCASDLVGINQWIKDSHVSNVITPITLDVSESQWPTDPVDAMFTANSLHIMRYQDVINFMTGAGILLNTGGHLVIYGPFNYNGEFTSASNKSFEQWLKSRDPLSGIKNFEDIEALANQNGFKLCRDYEMPANNRILHFIKS